MLTPQNRRFRFILDRVLPGLTDGTGGFSFSNIQVVFDEYGLRGGQRMAAMELMMVVIEAIRKIRKEERDKREQDGR